MDGGLERSSLGIALQHAWGATYNQEAFHYFLELEQNRSKVSNRPFLLMLVTFKNRRGTDQQIDIETAAKLFSILSSCLRETDFLGWYDEGRVAAAVLTQQGDPGGDEVCEIVRRRVGGALEKHFPSKPARVLEVRVCQFVPHKSTSE